MRELSEDEAWALAGDAECPVLAKAEADPSESAVCLKVFPGAWVLGVSCDMLDRFHLYAFDDETEAWAEYRRYVAIMERDGTPFGVPPRA